MRALLRFEGSSSTDLKKCPEPQIIWGAIMGFKNGGKNQTLNTVGPGERKVCSLKTEPWSGGKRRRLLEDGGTGRICNPHTSHAIGPVIVGGKERVNQGILSSPMGPIERTKEARRK